MPADRPHKSQTSPVHRPLAWVQQKYLLGKFFPANLLPLNLSLNPGFPGSIPYFKNKIKLYNHILCFLPFKEQGKKISGQNRQTQGLMRAASSRVGVWIMFQAHQRCRMSVRCGLQPRCQVRGLQLQHPSCCLLACVALQILDLIEMQPALSMDQGHYVPYNRMSGEETWWMGIRNQPPGLPGLSLSRKLRLLPCPSDKQQQ